MWVRSLGWDAPLEEGMATHSSILAWRIHGQKSLVGTAHGVAKSRTWLLRQHRRTHYSCRCRICYSRAPFSTEETESNASSHPWG